MSTIEFQDYAKDIKLNLGAVLRDDPESKLSKNQIYAIALSCAYAVKDHNIINYIFAQSGDILTEAEVKAAQTAATIMAMNNVYYRFVHVVSDEDFGNLPAKLRMNAMANPTIDKIDFELYSLAVSAINGCGLCIDSHVKQIVAGGVNKPTIQHAIRIASVINATAQALFIN